MARLQCSFNRMASELMEMDEEKRRLNEQLLTLQEEERGEIARICTMRSVLFFLPSTSTLPASRGLPIRAQCRDRPADPLGLGLRLPHTAADPDNARPLAPGCPGRLRFGCSRHEHGRVLAKAPSGIHFKVSLPPDAASFGALIDITIYRIVQESLSNAVRHGDPAGFRYR